MHFEREVHAKGRDLGLALSQTIEFVFRRRYNLPPTDPRFLDATIEDMVNDYWAHRHTDDPALRNEVIAEGFEEDAEEMLAESVAKETAALETERRAIEAIPEDDWEDI